MESELFAVKKPSIAAMKLNLTLIFSIISWVALFNPLNAQNVQGFVFTGSDTPISGVGIYLNSDKIAETNAEGTFILPDGIKPPVHLTLEHPQYYIKEVELTSNHSTFRLSPLSKSENLEEIRIMTVSPKTISADSKTPSLFAVESISSHKFDTYSPIGLVTALNEIPGLLIHAGTISTNRITIRGIGSRTLYGTNKIRAYFNGIPITNGGGETAIDIFDPENLESMVVIKGPKATQYGTNLGGTLLLHSKRTAAGETVLKSNITLGSYNLIKNTTSIATATEKLSFHLNYDHLETDGFRENNKYERSSVFLTAAYKFNSENEIDLLVGYIDYFAQIPSSIGKTAFEENPSQAATTWKEAQGYENYRQILNGLSFTHRFSNSFSNTSRFFYTYLDHYEPRPFDILDEFTHGYGVRTVFDKNFTLFRHKADISFGGEFYKDQYNWKTIENLYKDNGGNGSLEGELLSDNREDRYNLNVFALLTLSFTQKLKGQFGLNLHKTNYRFVDAFNVGVENKDADRDFNLILAPNANLRYQFSDNFNLFFNLSRGFNYPSIEETLTPDGLINPELGPEKGFNYEVGSQLFLLKKKFFVQINAYLMDIDNLLVAQRVGDDQYIGRNAGKTEHKGIEIQVSYLQPITNFGFISPYLNAEISDHKLVDFVDGEHNFSGNSLTGVPDGKVSGGFNIGFGDFLFNTNFLHVGAIPLNDANDLYSEKYTVLNLKTSYTKNLSEAISIEIQAGINNLGDERYASSILINATGFGKSEPRFYYPGMPRNWFGGIKFKYGF